MIVFGVTIATFITLFLVPLVYLVLTRRSGSPQAVGRRIDAALRGPQLAE